MEFESIKVLNVRSGGNTVTARVVTGSTLRYDNFLLSACSLLWHMRNVFFPTDPFTISEPQSQEIGLFWVVQERRGTGF